MATQTYTAVTLQRILLTQLTFQTCFHPPSGHTQFEICLTRLDSEKKLLQLITFETSNFGCLDRETNVLSQFSACGAIFLVGMEESTSNSSPRVIDIKENTLK
ncbi:Uncharacterised protein r2_g1155 [Pycnogonum litorale]